MAKKAVETKKETKKPGPTGEKAKAIKLAMDGIEKDFGKGTIQVLGDKPEQDHEAISTGSLGLDISLGIGGLPRGRIVEIYGPESAGKTTLATTIIANVQALGGTAAIVDAEHAFDTSWARTLGVDVDNLLISQPDYGEQALEVVSRLVSTSAVDVIVVDSVAALVPKAELDGEMGDSKMGLHARLMSQAMRKLAGNAAKTKTLIIFINQLRDKIGVMFGSPETTTGGNALKFYASVRLDIRRIGQVKDGEVIVANRIKVKVVKNKVAPPFKAAEFDLRFGVGIDKHLEILEAATALEIVVKAGSWYSYNGDKLGQGASTVRELLIDNPALYEEIRTLVRNKFFKH